MFRISTISAVSGQERSDALALIDSVEEGGGGKNTLELNVSAEGVGLLRPDGRNAGAFTFIGDEAVAGMFDLYRKWYGVGSGWGDFG